MTTTAVNSGTDWIKHNKVTYESEKVVQAYYRYSGLQQPETTIFNLLKPQLAEMAMLDMGVGGGRTTACFAPEVKSYVGTDYAENMIKACRQRFPNPGTSVSFAVADARNMANFGDSQYDLILFSFNGIDYLSEADRLTVFSEVQRLGKPGGYFCFSTHSLQGLCHLFSLKRQWSRHPQTLMENLHRWFTLRRLYNASQIAAFKEAPYAILNDGAHEFSLQTYYIQPDVQLKQLQPWFKDIQVYGLETGQQIQSATALSHCTDPWLYYLCRIR